MKFARTRCAASWTSAGRVVRIALPPKGFSDFNDALRAGLDPDELKRAILEADPVKEEDADDDENMRAEIDARLEELAALDRMILRIGSAIGRGGRARLPRQHARPGGGKADASSSMTTDEDLISSAR